LSLFPALYLNENVAVSLVGLLDQKGIKAIHTQDVLNKGASDEYQLNYAASNNYIIFTHNRKHFRALDREWTQKNKIHTGIIVARFAEPEVLATRIELFKKYVFPVATPPFCLSPPSIEPDESA